MDRALYHAVMERLEADAPHDPEVAERIREVCGDLWSSDDTPEPVRAWLQWIEVEGFRGIGEPLRLDLDAAPGLTIVAGRNGSGKSSLAEALEVLLTGTSRRWSDKAADFQRSWRNLHHSRARVAAGFVVEGHGRELVLERSWNDSDPQGVLRIDGKVGELSRVGWSDAVESWRPFLSGDLSRRLEGSPSALFDAMAGVLGLESLVEASNTLARRRRERMTLDKEADAARMELGDALGASDDVRAARALEALSRPDLELLASLVHTEPGGTPRLDDLRRVASVELPEEAEVQALAAALRGVLERERGLTEGLAGRGDRLARLLEVALDLQQAGQSDCPVCGTTGALDPNWVERARRQLGEAREAAQALAAARRERASLEGRARELLNRPGEAWLGSALAVGGDDTLEETVRSWSSGRELGGLALAVHLAERVGPLSSVLERARTHAGEQLEAVQAAWFPLAARIERWVELRREADRAREEARTLAAAEKWLVEAEKDLRIQRFAPIAEQARAIWDALRQESHVALESIELRGQKTRRRLGLQARIDDAETNALGVMSQGELNALALSLFVPRTTLPESPFRFLLIDDPVQAMDPHKVDGLALVLSDLARTRQTLVFTHDERLLESLRRLRRPARVWQVQRRPRSTVALTKRRDPVLQALEDAALVLSVSSLPSEVVERLVPGFCREAMEARLVEILRRRWIGRGMPHTEVEERLARHRSLRSMAALVLLDDARAGREVEGALERRFGPESARVFATLNAGAHGRSDLPPQRVLKLTGRLVRAMEGLD